MRFVRAVLQPRGCLAAHSRRREYVTQVVTWCQRLKSRLEGAMRHQVRLRGLNADFSNADFSNTGLKQCAKR